MYYFSHSDSVLTKRKERITWILNFQFEFWSKVKCVVILICVYDNRNANVEWSFVSLTMTWSKFLQYYYYFSALYQLFSIDLSYVMLWKLGKLYNTCFFLDDSLLYTLLWNISMIFCLANHAENIHEWKNVLALQKKLYYVYSKCTAVSSFFLFLLYSNICEACLQVAKYQCMIYIEVIVIIVYIISLSQAIIHTLNIPQIIVEHSTACA